MASFLDTGLLSNFSVIFTFLLVYAVIWGALLTRKPFGKENNGVYAIIAVAGAFLAVLSPPVRAYIEFITPWFMVLAIAFFLIVICVSIFTEIKWIDVIKYGAVRTWISIFIFVILGAGAFSLFGQETLEAGGNAPTNPMPVIGENGQNTPTQFPVGGSTATSNVEVNAVNTIVHPKVLGIMLIFGLSALIVYFLSQPAGGL